MIKKVMFIVRDGYDARFISNNIKQIQDEYQICFVLESGKIAQKKKLKRMFKKSRNPVQTVVDILALVIYNEILIHRMKKIENDTRYNSDIQFDFIDDVNDTRCLSIVEKYNPDVILIYGTGILSRETIANFGCDIYNIHSSILPYYRNVHSDFWAYVNQEYDKIGITIFKLNAEIDTGEIAIQCKCELMNDSLLEEYKIENLKNITRILPVFLSGYFDGNIQLTEQNNEQGTIANSPTARDIIKYFKNTNS